MKKANLVMLTLLAVILFVAGLVFILLFPHPTLSLGLMLAGFITACTTVLVNEIRVAKREIAEKTERRDGALL